MSIARFRPIVLSVGLVFWVYGACFAGNPKTLPAEVLQAKSIYLDGATDFGHIDELKKWFQDWGRYTVAVNERDADLVILLQPFGNQAMGGSLTVLDRSRHKGYWVITTDQSEHRYLLLLNEFRKRVERDLKAGK